MEHKERADKILEMLEDKIYETEQELKDDVWYWYHRERLREGKALNVSKEFEQQINHINLLLKKAAEMLKEKNIKLTLMALTQANDHIKELEKFEYTLKHIEDKKLKDIKAMTKHSEKLRKHILSIVKELPKEHKEEFEKKLAA